MVYNLVLRKSSKSYILTFGLQMFTEFQVEEIVIFIIYCSTFAKVEDNLLAIIEFIEGTLMLRVKYYRKTTETMQIVTSSVFIHKRKNNSQ